MTGFTEDDDAIAVIGMSCRFAPDLDSPEKLWESLNGGEVGAVRDMPAKRWEPYAASSPLATSILRRTTRLGMFLDDIEGFDAEFFGITPREAAYLDPQQRIVLELVWEALERAGIAPLTLRGSEAGVYVAANSNDYGRRLLEDIPRTGAWAVNGTTFYGIANRVSYFLDLRGPSLAVDTACAGSLTALHLACQGLRLGEAPVAIAGGINIISTPALNVALDAAGATSPDGRSKAFDKAADGYGRGEGGGIVVLKRLADARRDGDPILALILGSGVYQDGRSDGMMAPNSDAQAHMLRQVCARTGIDPESVTYVEAHGTGTTAGDSAEARALIAVFGTGRTPDNPCLFGTLKPNIGHVEAASGIAGVIKTILSLQHGQIPPSVHQEVNPDLELDGSGLRLVDQVTPWQRNGTPRRAGVSSYGVGGTIAHMILQEPDPVQANGFKAVEADPRVYPVSAMSEAGLRDITGGLADWLDENQGASLPAIGHTLATRRSHLMWRSAVVASSAHELAARLRGVANEQRDAGIVVHRTAAGAAGGVVWVFSGHGAQWPGMCRELLRDNEVFAAMIDRLGPVFEAELGWTPRQAITDGGPWTVSQVQSLTFATQVALAEVWRSVGAEPAAVIGHSVGEIAAGVVAGVLELEDAARFACRRAAALERVSGSGAMALVPMSFGEAERRLESVGGQVVAAIAASPQSTVLSGERAVLERMVEGWAADGINARWVDTDVAFHSPLVDPIVAEVGEAAAAMSPGTATIPLYSTALSDARSAGPRDRDYWQNNLRQPVRFAHAVTAALHDGYRLFLEVSTHPVVAHSIKETFEQLDVDSGAVAGTLKRNQPEFETLLTNLAQLHCQGAALDWTAHHTAAGTLVPLPPMTWQHRPFWIFPENAGDASHGGGHDPDKHLLLGGRTTVGGVPPKQVWQTYLDMSCRPYPQDHKVVGVETVPASVVINSFVAAATRGDRIPGLTDLVLRTPIAATPPRVVQFVLDQDTVTLTSRIADDEVDGDEHSGDRSDDRSDELAWLTHARATIDWTVDVAAQAPIDVAAIRARTPDEWTWERVDQIFLNMGVEGYTFPWVVEELRRNEIEQIATVCIEPAPTQHASSWTAVIDGALTVSGVLVTKEDSRRLRTSSRIDAIAFRGEPPARVFVHTTRSADSPEDTIDVRVADAHGQVVCQVTALRFTPVKDNAGEAVAPRNLVHEIVWRPLSSVSSSSTVSKVSTVEDAQTVVPSAILVGDGAVTEPLERLLTAAGTNCLRAATESELPADALSRPGVLVVSPEPIRPGETPEQAAERCAWTVIRTAQRISDHMTRPETVDCPQLWVVTQGVRRGSTVEALAHAPLWGISRIIAGERSDIWGGIVDVDSDGDIEIDERMLSLLRGAAHGEDILSLTRDDLSAARLSQLAGASESSTGLQCRAGGTYLVTGGLGALGLEVARWLVERGARRLVLMGRRGLPPRSQWASVTASGPRRQIDAVLALEALGATVRVVAADIGDAEQVAAALDPGALGMPPIRGVVHAAGVVSDALVDKVDLRGLQDVLGPKVYGAMVLHRLFPPGSLDFFVLFSSCGQLVRLTGQTTYAAGNSFLDALAAYRRSAGHTDTVSLAWTSWQGLGMADSTTGTTTMEANARGMDGISAADAFRAWAFADRFPGAYRAILRVLPPEPHATRLPILSELAGTGAADMDGTTAAVYTEWLYLPEPELRDHVIADVCEQVAAELNMSATDIDARRPLLELGVDSLLTVGLRLRLHRRYGIDLPATILWGHPTAASLATHLVTTLVADRTEVAPDQETANT